MLSNLNYRFGNTVMDALGALAPFRFNNNKGIQSFFEKRVTSKVEDSTLKLQGLLIEITDASPELAKGLLEIFESIKPMIDELHSSVEELEEEYVEVRNTMIHFINVFKEFVGELERISEYSMPAQVSEHALAEAWDSSEDNHWDNY